MTTPNTSCVIDHGFIEGLEAREIMSCSEYAPRCDQSVSLGDNFRFQLGRTSIRTFTFSVPDANGVVKRHSINASVFELVAFGRSFEAAVTALKQSRLPSALQNDDRAKKALEALAA